VKRKRRRRARDARELADAVFARQDPVEIGVELLSGKKRGDSVKARVWETLLEYRYGRPATTPSESRSDSPCIVQIISNIPRPARPAPRAAESAGECDAT